MRAFVALGVEEPKVLDSIQAVQAKLRATGADLKLVERENLHFTIRFLGEISEAQASEAATRLGALSLKGGRAEVRGVGAFPSAASPRVVWCGMSPEGGSLVDSIASSVSGALQGIGEQERGEFKAHLTLARVRSPRGSQALAAEIRNCSALAFGLTDLVALRLKSSTLTPRGPVYSDVGVYPLN